MNVTVMTAAEPAMPTCVSKLGGAAAAAAVARGVGVLVLVFIVPCFAGTCGDVLCAPAS